MGKKKQRKQGSTAQRSGWKTKEMGVTEAKKVEGVVTTG